jgi:hypothetical protein
MQGFSAYSHVIRGGNLEQSNHHGTQYTPLRSQRLGARMISGTQRR